MWSGKRIPPEKSRQCRSRFGAWQPPSMFHLTTPKGTGSIDAAVSPQPRETQILRWVYQSLHQSVIGHQFSVASPKSLPPSASLSASWQSSSCCSCSPQSCSMRILSYSTTQYVACSWHHKIATYLKSRPRDKERKLEGWERRSRMLNMMKQSCHIIRHE